MLQDSKIIIAERNFFTIFAKITLIVPLLKSAAKIFLIFLFMAVPLSAYSESLRESLRGDVTFLADSLVKGREFGTKGNLDAAFHINKSFRDAGLWARFQLYRSDGRTGRNVIGITPGFYDSYIVIGAHFDGLGFHGGRHYPGADSNASGVAALLALAREIVHLRSHTGVIFVAFDGYNDSMSGSSAFLEEAFKSYKIDLMVNLDILGATSSPIREGQPAYLIALGAAAYSWQLNSIGREAGLDLAFDYYGSSRFTDLFYKEISDQKWFLKKRIPSVMFTSGITMDTNRISDTTDKLDYDIMARRVNLISTWLSRYVLR